jgi:hypothetical protein
MVVQFFKGYASPEVTRPREVVTDPTFLTGQSINLKSKILSNHGEIKKRYKTEISSRLLLATIHKQSELEGWNWAWNCSSLRPFIPSSEIVHLFKFFSRSHQLKTSLKAVSNLFKFSIIFYFPMVTTGSTFFLPCLEIGRLRIELYNDINNWQKGVGKKTRS